MNARVITGVVVGGLLGYAAYRFIGYSSGGCPITGNPLGSTSLGMVIGWLLLNGFGDDLEVRQ